MNRPILFSALAMLAATSAAALPREAGAQQTITCSSQAGRRTLCTADARGGAYMVRNLGPSPCVFNRTWGFTAGAVWAANGCQGRFVVDRPPSRIPVMGVDAMRICRNLVAARLSMAGPSSVRADVRSSNLRGERAVKWLVGERTGTCFVNRTGEVTAWRYWGDGSGSRAASRSSAAACCATSPSRSAAAARSRPSPRSSSR
jgi:hypothetical protein